MVDRPAIKQVLILIAILISVPAVSGQIGRNNPRPFYRSPDPIARKPFHRGVKPNPDLNKTIAMAGWVQKAHLLLERSKSYRAAGIRPGLWRDVNHAVAIAPGDEAIFKIAIGLMLEDETVEVAEHVIDLADALIAIDPTSGAAYHFRSKAKIIKKDYLGSLMDASKAIDFEPWNRTHSTVRLSLLNKLSGSDGTLSLFQFAIDRMETELLSPLSAQMKTHLRLEIAQAYEARSRYYKRIRDHASQISDLTKAIEIAEGQTLFLIYRAEAFREAGKYREAIADFTRAIEIAMRYRSHRRTAETGLRVRRGDIYVLIGEFEKAIEDYQIALKLEPIANKYIEAKILAVKQKQSDTSSIKPN